MRIIESDVRRKMSQAFNKLEVDGNCDAAKNALDELAEEENFCELLLFHIEEKDIDVDCEQELRDSYPSCFRRIWSGRVGVIDLVNP